MDEYDSLKEEWRNLIGSFMLEFCEIEYVAYKLWTDKKAGNNMPHNFKERAGQVISKLNGNKYKDLRELLERAVKISDKRNTIAHNPMQLHI